MKQFVEKNPKPKEKEIPSVITENPWFFLRIVRWMVSTIYKGYRRLFPAPFLLPDNEAGELMREVMANQSWFDKLSSGWVAQPLLTKTTLFSALFLPIVFTGVSVGFPLLLSTCALFVFSGIHALLVSHEKHRREKAHLFAEKTIALNNDLKATQAVMDKAVEKIESVAGVSNDCYQALKKNAELLSEDAKNLREEKTSFVHCVDVMQEKTQDLLVKEIAVKERLQAISGDMHTLEEGMTQINKSLHSFDNAATSFNESITSLQSVQKAYSDSMSRFGLFLDEQRERTMKLQANPIQENRTYQAIWDEIAETDAFIAEMMAQSDEEEEPRRLVH